MIKIYIANKILLIAQKIWVRFYKSKFIIIEIFIINNIFIYKNGSFIVH